MIVGTLRPKKKNYNNKDFQSFEITHSILRVHGYSFLHFHPQSALKKRKFRIEKTRNQKRGGLRVATLKIKQKKITLP